MKKVLSKLSLFILVLSMMLGFGSTVAFAYDEAAVSQITSFYFEIWNQTDFQLYIDEGAATDEVVLKQYTEWQEIKNQIGAYEGAVETKIEEIEGTIVVTQIEKFTNSNLHFILTFDKVLAEQDPTTAILSIEAVIPNADAGTANMAKAGMNTLMGMGIVFCVLVFISVVIWLLKFVPMLLDRKKTEEVTTVPFAPPAAAPAAVAAARETEETELVAVITAAIMALRAEENGGDGSFTVRSIRRRH